MNRFEEILQKQESIIEKQTEILGILKDVVGIKEISTINERLDALEELAGIENDHQGV